MTDPVRLVDDPRAPKELRSLLVRVPRARALEPMTRHRMGRRLSRFLSLPLVLTVGLTMKTAAAAFAVATGGLVAGAVVMHEVQVLRALSIPLQKSSQSASQRPAAPLLVERTASAEARPDVRERLEVTTAIAAFPDDNAGSNRLPTPRSGTSPLVKSMAAASSVVAVKSSSLELEAAMLETARRALATSPAEALAIVEEHRARFPRATLTSERDLIQLDALCRIGRRAEARQLGDVLRRRGGLYAERVDRLLERMDGND